MAKSKGVPKKASGGKGSRKFPFPIDDNGGFKGKDSATARVRKTPTDRIFGLDPIRNFRFRVKIESYTIGRPGWAADSFDAYMGFTSVSGLSMTMTSIPYQEGGLNTTTHQIPGLASYSPVTFQRGVFLGNQENWEWLRRLVGTVGNSGYGAPGGNFRMAMRIDVLSSPNPGSRASQGGGSSSSRPGFYNGMIPGTEVLDDHATMSVLLAKAWITTMSYSDLNAGDSALVVEQMTVAHEGMHVVHAQNYGDSANAFREYRPLKDNYTYSGR